MTTAVETQEVVATAKTPALEDYFGMSEGALYERIESARRLLGSRLIILGHHYQRDDVICHADYTGDSFKLSKLAAEHPEADYVVFCGVHFMAESADILRPGDQKVILPDLGAGCSMADMATSEQVEDAWEQLGAIGLLAESKVVPVTYMNSSAAIKAFCGEHDGVVCTSSNAVPLFDKYLKEADKLFFFPDQHLGRNTGVKFGIPLEEMVLWDPNKELGGNTPDELRRARLILWKGHCSVHGRFRPWHVEQVRNEVPGIKVIVHPECEREVVAKSDLNGSTEFIIKAIEEAPAGSAWAVGTEVNLVTRLAAAHPDKEIRLLAPDLCMCATMYRIAPQNLAWVLDSLVSGHVVNQITVPAETARWAHVALDRMLAIK
ncbi:MAG: quinolinate synthase [Acidobacteriota bacterium]|jgi:quinolinate synthase|nr:quinolinate synthase [Acidobacteriota bacterium]